MAFQDLEYIFYEIMMMCSHKAIELNQILLFKLFIKHWAAIYIKDKAWNTALHKATICGHHNIVRLLLKKLGDHRAMINCRNYSGQTALDIAIINGNYPCVILLIQGGAEINPIATSNDSEFPLYLAVKAGNLEIVKLLIKNGANLKAKYSNDRTALHMAVTYGRAKDANRICEILLKNGVNVDSKNKELQNTALHLEVRKGNDKCNEEIIQTILNFGANTELTNKYTLKPFEYAIVKGNSKAVKVLVENGLYSSKTRRLEYFDVNCNALEIALKNKQHGIKNSHNVIKTMLYGMSKN